VDELRIGVIGVGYMAKNFHIPALRRLDGLEIAATCDTVAKRCLPGLPAYLDYREMLEKETLDLVYVLTPPGAHLEPVCLALERGCHVFCEMPPALEPLDTAQMIAFARETNCSLLFGTNRHFAPAYRNVRKLTRQRPPKMTVLTKCRRKKQDYSADDAQALEHYNARQFLSESASCWMSQSG
jgi:predicted dehydrogenase